MVEQFSGLLTDLSEFLAFFVVSLVLVIVFVAVYTNVTRHSEIKLIKENSVAAALAFSGSMIGFALPLASAMISSSTILEMVVWGVIALIVYEQQGQRKIPVNYAKRVVGRRVYGAQNAYLPFKINPSGVIPVIFASSVLIFPLQIAQNLGSSQAWLSRFAAWLRPNGVPYVIVYALLIIFFAYFYTQVTLNPVEIARQIRENGGSIRGISSDKMREYLTRILNRIILPGALFLAFIAIIPSIIQALFAFPAGDRIV